MDAFDKALGHVFGVEGGFSNHALDSGGRTNWGITERTARTYGYDGPMQAMPQHVAASIYRQAFWKECRLDLVADVDEALAIELFDTGVNCGPAVAGRFLQRALNVLNKRGSLYADIAVDGIIGFETIGALRQFQRHRSADGITVLLRVLNSLQGAYYVDLAERREKDEEFIFGWFRTRVHL